MGEKVSAQFDFDKFELPDEGYYVLKVEDVEIVPSEATGGLTFKVTSVIDGGQFDGQKHWDNFGTRVKKHFGIKKMLGLLVKSGKMNEDATLDSDYVETAEFQKEFKKSVKNARYGAYVSHRDWTDKDGKSKTSTNIDKYLTVDEVKEKIKEMDKPVSNLKPESASAPEAPKPKSSVWK